MTAHISLSIGGRKYRMACQQGQEAHLERLAQDLDSRFRELRTRFGEISDTRLAVMAALTVTDELVEAGKRLRRLEQELAELQAAREGASQRSRATKTAVAAALVSAAERIERVVKALGQERKEEKTLPFG